MELLNGETLADYLHAHGPVSQREALAVFQDIAGALAAAHKLKIVHRDLKPGNVMMERREGAGSRHRAVVMDFGIARSFFDGKTENTGPRGTLSYMSPEQT